MRQAPEPPRPPGRPLHGRTAHARRRPARGRARWGQAHDNPGQGRVPGGRPGQSGLHGDGAERVVGGGLHLRAHVGGFVYVAFIIDVFSRQIVGWKADTSMRADLVTDTLEMAVWARQRAGIADLSGVIHHTDAGSQYVSLALTERLAALGMRASIGTVGDAYDNALAESTIGLYKTELIRRRGPWRTLDHVEIATLEWVDWFNNRRLHTELGHVTPAEREADFYQQQPVATMAATREPSLH
nr:IS3 family transposase [Sanguibacter hominis]